MELTDQDSGTRHAFLYRLNERFAQYIQKHIYPYVTRRLDGDDVLFLNYGYEEDPPLGVPLAASDEPNRYPIQLYHRTATQVDLSNKQVLEVGCGHGGGASYIVRTLHPSSYVGLDLNPAGIAYCRKRYRIPGLEFVQGDAEDLPFPDRSFDAVINVESSHLYPRFPRFLTEAARVLRPGGHLLYADGRAVYSVAAWNSALADAPLRVISQRDINPGVVRGMERNVEQWQDVIDRIVPTVLRRFFRACAPAERAYEDLRSGATEYRMYCFTKE
jgi:ubiquinone/menaquinone biosynthesis C-methylase UbiE